MFHFLSTCLFSYFVRVVRGFAALRENNIWNEKLGPSDVLILVRWDLYNATYDSSATKDMEHCDTTGETGGAERDRLLGLCIIFLLFLAEENTHRVGVSWRARVLGAHNARDYSPVGTCPTVGHSH